MNVKQFEGTAQALVANDKGLLTTDESNGPTNARSSTATKPPVSMRKMALSLSQFLKKQRSSLASRRQDGGKQAQPGRQ
jgi:fructose-bisphosphate aldolase class 1